MQMSMHFVDLPAVEPVKHYADDFRIMPDDGCNLAPSCLACPLPACKYDDPAAARDWRSVQSGVPLLEARQLGASIPQLQLASGLSRRTLYRRLAAARAAETEARARCLSADPGTRDDASAA